MILYIAIAIIGICFLTSIVSFKLNYPFHLKLLSALVGYAFLTEIWANFLIKPLHMGTNMYVYNSYILAEYWVYALYFRFILRSAIIKKIVIGFLYVFPLFWFYTTFFVFGIKGWNSYVVVAGSFFTVCFAFTYYFQVFTDREMSALNNNSEFWIATGLIFFYSCQLPYAGMLHFLNTNFRPLAQNLLVVLQILNIIMYAFFTYAFLCRTTIKKY